MTEAGGAYSGEGGDVVTFDFGKKGMTVTKIKPGGGVYLQPRFDPPPTDDAIINSAIEVKVNPANKHTRVGLFCRRESQFTDGYLFLVEAKKWQILSDDPEEPVVSKGKIKGFKPRKVNTVRAECAKDSQNGFGVGISFTINGEEVFSGLDFGSNRRFPGLYFESADENKKAKATFSDLIVEELPPPTS